MLGQSADSTARELYIRGWHLYYDAGKFDSARILLSEARSLFTPGTMGEADVCYVLGDIYKYELYDFDKAEACYDRALTIRQELQPNDVGYLTRLYYSLATTNRSQHDYETALSWCGKAVQGCITIGDEAFLERTYSIAGNIYRDIHQFDSALVYYMKCEEVNKRLNKGKDNLMLANLYVGWGETNYLQNDMDGAAKKLSYAASTYRKNQAKADKALYLHATRLLAELAIKRNNLDVASIYLKTADDIRRARNLERGGPASSLYKTEGDYMLARGDRQKALECYQRALQATTSEQLTTTGNPSKIGEVEFKNFAYDALLSKAALVNDKEALECYSAAERLMAWSRNELDTEDAKWNYIDANYKLYENIFDVLIRQENHDESELFHYIELTKSKSLADALQEVELKRALGKNDTLFTKLRRLRQGALEIQHQINEKNESNVRDQLISNSQEISRIEQAINTLYPSYFSTRYEGQSVSLSSVKSKIKAIDAVLVEYFWGFEHIFALVVTPDSARFYQLGESSRFSEEVSKYVGLFGGKTNQYSGEAVAEFSTLSNSLYKLLLQPFREQMSGRKRLIIVPDGPLMQVPFETLVTGTGEAYNRLPYLLNDHIVSYVFSASQLVAVQQIPKSNPSLLAFGFTGGAELRYPSDTAIEISGSETELIALSNKFPDGTFLYGAGVTEKNFKERAANFDLIHLAVHGSGDTGEDYSATLYFRDKDGPEDGRLYWYELYNLNLKASLAVLSSCESGIGKTYRGEGMLSMANAFTFAGCDNIVMGLWKVDDQVSVKLMDKFYSSLLDGMAIDEALAIAKRAYLASADQVSANPKLWGSLVAYGEAPILRADEIPTTWVVIALTVLAAAIIILVRKTRKK